MQVDESETLDEGPCRPRRWSPNVIVGRPVPEDSVREIQPKRTNWPDGRTRVFALLFAECVLGVVLLAICFYAITFENDELINRLLDVVVWGGGVVLAPVVGAKTIEVLKGSGSSHGP